MPTLPAGTRSKSSTSHSHELKRLNRITIHRAVIPEERLQETGHFLQRRARGGIQGLQFLLLRNLPVEQIRMASSTGRNPSMRPLPNQFGKVTGTVLDIKLRLQMPWRCPTGSRPMQKMAVLLARPAKARTER